MDNLFEAKVIKYFKRAILKEDKEGIDYFLRWDDKEVWSTGDLIKAQFKNRDDKYQDIPVCRFQPFYGTDNKKTKIGRDYKALQNNMNEIYLTAVKPDGINYTEVLLIKSKKLFEHIIEAEAEWFGNDEPWAYFDTKLCDKTTRWDKKLKTAKNGVQAWFKRTRTEKAAKINLYVPRQYAEEVFVIKPKV